MKSRFSFYNNMKGLYAHSRHQSSAHSFDMCDAENGSGVENHSRSRSSDPLRLVFTSDEVGVGVAVVIRSVELKI